MTIKQARLRDVPAGRNYNLSDLTKKYNRRTLYLGRSHNDCDIPLGEGLPPAQQSELRLDKVSRIHVIIRQDVQGDSFYIMDDRSTNGTILNGELLEKNEEYLLRPGDEIFFGTIRGYGPVILEEARNSDEFQAVRE